MNNCQQFFPALQNYPDFIFSNNAAGTQIPIQVKNRIDDYITRFYNQPQEFTYQSKKVIEFLQESRKFSDIFFNNKKGFIVYGCSASQLAFNFSYQFSEILEDQDEIILSNFSHESAIGCFERMNKKNTIKWWNIDTTTYQANVDELLQLVTEKTRIIIFPHVCNILGNILDVKNIVRQIKEINSNIYTYIDGVAYSPHDIIDVEDYNCDCYVVSFYKLFGLRISALYIKKDLSDQLSGINHSFIEKKNQIKFELGGPQYELACTILGIKDYILQIMNSEFFDRILLSKFFKEVKTFEQELVNNFDHYINNQDNFKLITDIKSPRVPIFSLINEQHNVNDIARFCNTSQISCNAGHFNSKRLIESLKLKAVLRFSLVHYNTTEHIKSIFDILKKYHTVSHYQDPNSGFITSLKNCFCINNE